MAEFPALPIFTDAFIADTLHLNAAQTGAYLMLLMCAWRTKTCSLPDDDEQLSRFARMDKRTWAVNKDVILRFWSHNSAGQLIQKRLVDERKFAEHKRDQATQAGKASALKRKDRHSTDVITEAQRKTNNPTTLPTPTIEKDLSKDKSSNNSQKPEDVSQEVWEDFKKLRKGKRAAITETTIKGIRTEAEKIEWGLERALSEMCARGWQGFKSSWVNEGDANGKIGNYRKTGNSERARAAAFAGFEITTGARQDHSG